MEAKFKNDEGDTQKMNDYGGIDDHQGKADSQEKSNFRMKTQTFRDVKPLNEYNTRREKKPQTPDKIDWVKAFSEQIINEILIKQFGSAKLQKANLIADDSKQELLDSYSQFEKVPLKKTAGKRPGCEKSLLTELIGKVLNL